MEIKDLRIDGQRLRSTLEEIAKIGATPRGGVHRLALSDEDRRGRDLFVQWLRDLAVQVTIDEMGNIFGLRAGQNGDLAPVMTGSHIDSQPQGGRFDGILGVLGALEVLRTLAEKKVETLRPVAIVDWTNEEGSRFPPAMCGSGVWSGSLKQDEVYQRTDPRGRSIGEELERIGYKGKRPAKAWPLHSYYELHIEQGPVLEKEDRRIGVPRGIVGIGWYDVALEGEANQVGPTPMKGRKDALCAAAKMVLKVNEIAAEMGGDLVATVGEIHNFPNSRNIIPGRVHFTLDIRSWEDEKVCAAWQRISEEFSGIARLRGVGIKTAETWRVAHAPFDEALVQRVWKSAEELGYAPLAMVSGAGHDASYMSRVAPTAMIFVPSIGGRSHVEVENTTWEDCAAGADVLLHCVLHSALAA